MTNKTTTPEEVKELVVDAHFVLDSYAQTDKNGKTVDKAFVSLNLIEPFKGEDFFDIPLKAKWDKYDDNNRLVRPDRVFDCMKYYAKKALHTSSEVPIKVTIKPVTYKNKRLNKMITYPAMFAAPTFAELEDERPVELVIKNASNSNIFSHLAGRALGISFTDKEDPDSEDIGLLE